MTAFAGPRPTPMRRRRVAALALALAGLASGGLVVAPSGPVGAAGRAPSVSASALVGLHRGDRGAAVSALQQRLVAFGYVLSVDGVFGSATEHAVADFQRANGLTPSGVVGATTARYLGVATGSTAAAASSTGSSASNTSASSSAGLRRGSQGSSVRALQARLAGFGYAVEHDGVFGHLTAARRRALPARQRAHTERRRRHRDRPQPRPHQRKLVRQHIEHARARRWPPPRRAAGCGAGVRVVGAGAAGAPRRVRLRRRARRRVRPPHRARRRALPARQRTHTERRRRRRDRPRPRPHQRHDRLDDHRRRAPRAARCRWARRAMPWPASSVNCSEPASR